MRDEDKSKGELIEEVKHLRKLVNQLLIEDATGAPPNQSQMENKKLVEELRQSEERWLALLNKTPVGVCFTNEEGFLDAVNPAYCEIYGYTTEELLGQHFTVVVPKGDREELAKLHDAFIAGQGEARGEWEVINKKQEILTVLCDATRIRSADGRLQKATFVMDITRRKRAEQALQHYTQELRRSNQELQEFASIASHDLQEPLRKIISFGDLLRGRLQDVGDESSREYVERMQGAARRMKSLIEDLLQYARVTAKAQPFSETCLETVMGEVLGDLETYILETRGCIEVGPLPTVLADKRQMGQLFQNLLGNALKFHRPDQAPVVSVISTSLEDCWEICIQDNGIGFDERYKERIFGPFQRLHGPNEYPGSGMGLAICQKIVERHRGSIMAQSILGEGSLFKIRLAK